MARSRSRAVAAGQGLFTRSGHLVDVTDGSARLHVLLETDGEHDALLAAERARAGKAELVSIAYYRQVPAALNHLLAA